MRAAMAGLVPAIHAEALRNASRETILALF
jgi:hypothetical protein